MIYASSAGIYTILTLFVLEIEFYHVKLIGKKNKLYNI